MRDSVDDALLERLLESEKRLYRIVKNEPPGHNRAAAIILATVDVADARFKFDVRMRFLSEPRD